MKRILRTTALLLTALLLLASCSNIYELSKESMAPYFDFDRSAYTGLQLKVDQAYEITDEMVESYIQDILWQHRHTVISQKISLGDEVGLYIRATHNGQPLPPGAVPPSFTALRHETEDADDPYYYRYNFYSDESLKLKLGENDGLPALVRDALLTVAPNETKRVASGGTVLENEKVCITYYAYYTKGEETVFLSTAFGAYFDLADLPAEHMAQKAVGEIVGTSYKFVEKQTIEGTEYDVTYECLVETIIDEEIPLLVSHTLANDTFAADSEYAYLNGETIEYHIVVSGIYRVPSLTEDFLANQLDYYPDVDDTVAAFRKEIKDSLIQEQKEEHIYGALWAEISSRLSPARYPDRLVKQTEDSIRSILSDPEFTQGYATAGFSSSEAYIRAYFGITEAPYKDLSLEVALRTYIYDLRDQEMLYYYFLQVEGITFTEEEYQAYLARRSEDLSAYTGVTYTPQETEQYFDSYYGMGYLGTGFLRECLLYEHIAEFIYQNNELIYVDLEDAA